jgi:predicted NBD/HSP70 family sugar kinase
MSLLVALDGGGTKIAGAAYGSLKARMPVVRPQQIRTAGDFGTDIRNIAALVRQLGEDARRPVTHIGFAAPGLLNPARTHMLSAGNLTPWIGHDIPFALRQELSRLGLNQHLTIVMGNDGMAQAMAEAVHNPRVRGKTFLFWGVGTGIATGWVNWVGGCPHGAPTEVQHNDIKAPKGHFNRRRCGCYSRKCVEALGSGRAVEQIRGVKASTLKTFAEWEPFVECQAAGLKLALSANTDTEMVVLGGGVVVREPRLTGWLQQALDAKVMAGAGATIVPAELGEHVGTLGALALLSGV